MHRDSDRVLCGGVAVKMFESILENAVTGGVIAASVLAYMRFRLEKLEQCLLEEKDYRRQDVSRVHQRLDDHIDRKVD